MAHQAHSLPWQTFSSHFSYYRKPHLDPFFPDIYAQDKPSQAKDLEYFSKAFVSCIKEASQTERRKYMSPEKMKERAKTWKVSRRDEGKVANKERNREWKSPTQQTIEKAFRSEDRKVFSDALREKYPFDEDCFEWSGLDPKTQHIEDWPGKMKHMGGGCLNTIKILMIQAGLATHPICQRVKDEAVKKEYVETLLLLAHHPDIPRVGYWWIYTLRSNPEEIQTLAEKALQAYLFFNLLYCLQSTELKLFTLLSEDEPKHPQLRNAYSGPWLPESMTAAVNKKYMNTLCWAKCAGYLTNGEDAEVVMYRPYLFPKWETGEGEEVKDVMKDLGVLREFLKGLWRVIVLYEMIEEDLNQLEINWEEMILHRLVFMVRNVKTEYSDN